MRTLKIFSIVSLCLLVAATAFGAGKPLATWTKQFAPNVGLVAEEDLLKDLPECWPLLKMCIDRPNLVLVCIGTADSKAYSSEHYLKNANIALQRLIAGYNLAISAGVPRDQVLMQVGTEVDSGFAFRTLTYEVYERVDIPPRVQNVQGAQDSILSHLGDVDDRLQNLEQLTKYLLALNRPQPKSLCLSLSLGGASTAFSATPYVQAALSWKQRFAIDFQGGVSPWSQDRTFAGAQYTTRSRFIGVHGTYYFQPNGPIGITAGYERHERLNTDVGEYLQRHEAYALGFRGRYALSRLFDFTAEAFWLPGERYTFPSTKVSWTTDTFRLGAGITLNLGGRS